MRTFSGSNRKKMKRSTSAPKLDVLTLKKGVYINIAHCTDSLEETQKRQLLSVVPSLKHQRTVFSPEIPKNVWGPNLQFACLGKMAF